MTGHNRKHAVKGTKKDWRGPKVELEENKSLALGTTLTAFGGEGAGRQEGQRSVVGQLPEVTFST